MIEKCPKCGEPCIKCRCKVSPCHPPLEEEADSGELMEVEVPEEEKHDAYKKKEESK